MLRYISVTVLAAVLFFPGCYKRRQARPAHIKLNGPSTRPCELESVVAVQFKVLGEKVKTLLGGSDVPMVGGVRVAFHIAGQPDGAGARLGVSDGVTDAGGFVTVDFTIGSRPGVYKLKAELPDYPEIKPAVVVFLGGVVLSGDKQDGTVGGSLENPIRVRVQSAPGVWARDVLVQVDLRHAAKGTRVGRSEILTDENGFASVEVKLGKKQGKGEIGIQLVKSPLGPEAMRYTLVSSFFAIDYFNLAVNVLGGLAIFIFGMKLMSEGLSLIAGDKLRELLRFLTGNRFAAVGVGLFVTGLIQSSSACTVMVIGFVNAGLMQLEQAIGVIMGANIGTTVTAQMISFKLTALALPAIVVGLIMSLLAKRSQTRFVGQILIGFGILFLGMGMMAHPLKQLKDSQTIKTMFHGLDCSPAAHMGRIEVLAVIKAVAAGTLLTVVVQSSSASIGLLMALSGAGLLNIYTAFAILLGDNIGTTVTAVLASISASRVAKRAACAHFLFNILGTTVMVILFFVPWPQTGHPLFMEFVSRLTDGNNFAGENLPRYLANAHTLFNVSCTICFVGFISVFAAICRYVIPIREDVSDEKAAKRLLEPHLLATPSIAIQQAWLQLGDMLKEGRMAHDESFDAIVGAREIDWEHVKESVRAHENDIDRLQTEITEYVSEISMESLTESQSLMLPRLMHAVNDVERIGDHSMHMLRLARRVRKRQLELSPDAIRELQEMMRTLKRLFEICDSAIVCVYGAADDLTAATPASIRELAQEADQTATALKKQASEFRKAHVTRQETGQESGQVQIRSSVIFVDMLLYMNRVGGHLFNIIEAVSPEGAEG